MGLRPNHPLTSLTRADEWTIDVTCGITTKPPSDFTDREDGLAKKSLSNNFPLRVSTDTEVCLAFPTNKVFVLGGGGGGGGVRVYYCFHRKA